MKKLVALITVAMFVLSFAAPAFAAATASDSFYKLKGLGVAYGDQNGNAMLDKTYTRAEAAALMVQLSGMKDAVSAAKGATKFKDVPASHWASGVVNLAVGNGIVKGYPNGTYAPDKPVTYAEMAAMLVQVLGYAPKLQGTWPNNVIGKAAELGLLDGLKVSNYSDAAVRGQVFIACNNALDVNILEEDADGQGYTKAGKLIDEKFSSAVYDDVDYKVADWTVDSDNQFVLTLEGDDPRTTADETKATPAKLTFDVTLAKDAVVEGGIAPSKLKGQLVNLVYNSDDDEATYIDLVSTKISTSDVDKDGSDKLKVNGTSYKFASGFSYSFVDATGVDDGYDIYLDGDNHIYAVTKDPQASAISAPKMIDEVKSNKTIDFMDSGSVDADVDNLLVVKDGKIATLADLKRTDVVYYKKDAYGVDLFIDAYTTSKTGTFDGLTGDGADQLLISNTKYDQAANIKISTDNGDTWDGTTDDLDGQNVTFALNKSGDVAFIMAGNKSDSNAIYGVVEDYDYTTKDVVNSIELMTSTGTNVTYDVNTSDLDVTYDGGTKDTDPDETITTSEFVKVTLDSNGKIDTLDEVKPNFTVEDANKDLLKVKVTDDKGTVSTTDDVTAWYYVNADTKIIDGNGDGDAKVVGNSDFLGYIEDNGAIANAFVKLDGSKVKFILVDAGKDGLDITAADKALVLSKMKSNDKSYVTVDIRGTVTKYELSSSSDVAYAAVNSDDLYDYNMDGTKIKLSNEVDFASTTGAVYGEVTDLDAASKSIEISNGLENISVDADTYIYDMTGSTDKYVKDFSSINEGDCVFVLPVTGDADRKGVADWVFIVDDGDSDYAGMDFSVGATL